MDCYHYCHHRRSRSIVAHTLSGALLRSQKVPARCRAPAPARVERAGWDAQQGQAQPYNDITSRQGHKRVLEPQTQNIPVMTRFPSLSPSHIFELSKRFRSLVVLLTHLIRRVSCNVQSSYSPFRAVQAMLQDHLLDVGNPNGPAGPAGHPHRTAVQLLGNRQPQPIPSSPPLSAAEAASQVKGGQGKVELSW